MQVPRTVQKVIRTLEDQGYETVLVGGCVRDALLGRVPKDYDAATAALPDVTEKSFARTILTGKKHGTVTVLEEGLPVEVTTFRHDGEYEDGRHPKQVEFVTSLEEDLRRRDFTINAMAWSLDRGLIDPFGGQHDLQAGLIRAVGDPVLRFQEDALRMLRAYRFAARFDFALEEQTEQAIKTCAGLLQKVAVERIVPELEEIMQTRPEKLEDMTDLLQPWLPELGVMKETAQNTKYHYTDVLHHTLDALASLQGKPWDPEVAWAVLLHDTGKPAVKQTWDGADHFKMHPAVSEKIARRVVRDLKLPRKMQQEIPVLVKYHDSFYAPTLKNLYKLCVERGWSDAFLRKLFAVQYADIAAHAIQDRKPQLDAFIAFYEAERKRRPMSLQQLDLNGTDLKELGLEGPAIRSMLESALHHAFFHPEDNQRAILLEKIREGHLQPLVQKEPYKTRKKQPSQTKQEGPKKPGDPENTGKPESC